MIMMNLILKSIKRRHFFIPKSTIASKYVTLTKTITIQLEYAVVIHHKLLQYIFPASSPTNRTFSYLPTRSKYCMRGSLLTACPWQFIYHIFFQFLYIITTHLSFVFSFFLSFSVKKNAFFYNLVRNLSNSPIEVRLLL